MFKLKNIEKIRENWSKNIPNNDFVRNLMKYGTEFKHDSFKFMVKILSHSLIIFNLSVTTTWVIAEVKKNLQIAILVTLK